MTSLSREQTDELKWASIVLFLAALYNLVWGVVAAVAPLKMLLFIGVSDPRLAGFWQCIGMFVALYGIGYWFASADPVRYWPFVLIGLIGKVLGPIGAVLEIASGGLPKSFFWVNVTNDLIWWVPFAWTLWVVRRLGLQIAYLPGDNRLTSLYRRVIGPGFDDLTPQVRQFHSATQPISVHGVFRVCRGDSTLGNWLTDRAGFPRVQDALDVSLVVEPHASGEKWRRSFAGATVES